MNCIICNNVLTGRQTKFCSKKCKAKHNASISNSSQAQYERGLKRKLDLIELKGGACQKCGYSKCVRALSFHHREPKLKEFPLDGRKLSGTSWERILAEAEKCDLLCLNCHAEHHEAEDRPSTVS